MFIIYKHQNKINNKCYIGQTKNSTKKRWGENGNRYVKSSNIHFSNAIQKYGWDNFTHEIIAECETQEEANLLESKYIELYDSLNNGYNMTSGGNLKKTISKETRELQSKVRKQYIKDHPEYKKIIVQNLKTPEHLSEEHKKHISESHIGLSKGQIPWNKGKKMDKKYCDNVKKYAKRGKDNKLSKAIIATNKLTNEEIEFGSICEAARMVGLANETSIVACLKGRAKSSAGYYWRYK